MAKTGRTQRSKSIFRCQTCGHAESRWLGKCPACDEWGTLVEELDTSGSGRVDERPPPDVATPVSIEDVEDLEITARVECGIHHLRGPVLVGAIAERHGA